jgi:hypothetical protein
MSETFTLPDDPRRTPSGELPDDLPPVEPPSAGFLAKLFVIPALIVLAIVGVWALFGRIAASEDNWQDLVKELRSGNEHRRWRAALGLAQMLKADQDLGDEGRSLARDPQVSGELTTLLTDQLGRTSPTPDDYKHQAFLARTLGFLDRPEIVLPALQDAMKPTRDLDVRRNSIASIALVLGRAQDRGESVANDALVDVLIETSDDPELSIRQLGVYSLGLAPTRAARQKLEVLAANDREDGTIRGNAAVGLARQGSTAGMPFFRKVLKDAAAPGTSPLAQDVELVAVTNTLKAVVSLKDVLTAEERSDVAALISPIADGHATARIRYDAKAALEELR